MAMTEYATSALRVALLAGGDAAERKVSLASGAQAAVYFEGANSSLTGLTSGLTYVLSAATPGAVVDLASAPAADGNTLQVLGVATAANEINTEIDTSPIVRAA